ncbi:hypothetical protein HPP92_020723 [Vanilla planifolia]|uniref:Uncharacterized protein n=1 Tax=Vanilla planifolia TaxID=51239 RepID=A0A835UHV4_VANPL|nr:hypothetical protein HPP92_020723 [Vanilla planifolia]
MYTDRFSDSGDATSDHKHRSQYCVPQSSAISNRDGPSIDAICAHPPHQRN